MRTFAALVLFAVLIYFGGIAAAVSTFALTVLTLAGLVVLAMLDRRPVPPVLRQLPPNVTRLRPKAARGAHAPRANSTSDGPLHPAA